MISISEYLSGKRSLEDKKDLASGWFKELRNKICAALEELEMEKGSQIKFERTPWKREAGGGGEMSIIRAGEVFEKGGVNISTVWGEFPENFSKEMPGTEKSRRFWASGISLVLHPRSPKVPIVHMNTRMICTEEKLWWGGGGDLTPVFPKAEDTEFFHQQYKTACDKFNSEYYPKFKKECDDYFFIKHRNEARGVGGIFYDYLNTENWDQDFDYTKEVGLAFLAAYPEIVRRNYNLEYNAEDKKAQLIKRAKYAEFNLVYDRGTRFGFMTGGNTEAILMSLPPECIWP